MATSRTHRQRSVSNAEGDKKVPLQHAARKVAGKNEEKRVAMEQKENKEGKLSRALLDIWHETRALTYDLIKETPLEKLNEKVDRPGLNTIAKHIYELALVQRDYADVLLGKHADFSNVEGITFRNEEYVARDKQELVKMLEEADAFFGKVTNSLEDWGKEVSVFGRKMPGYAVIDIATSHETMHQGQFVMICYSLGIKFPKSWVDA